MLKKGNLFMKIGCFACVEPFAPMSRQLKAIRDLFEAIFYGDTGHNFSW